MKNLHLIHFYINLFNIQYLYGIKLILNLYTFTKYKYKKILTNTIIKIKYQGDIKDYKKQINLKILQYLFSSLEILDINSIMDQSNVKYMCNLTNKIKIINTRHLVNIKI